MKFKLSKLAIGLAAAVAFSGTAFAQQTYVSGSGNNQTFDLGTVSSTSGVVSQNLSSSLSSGSFSDIFTFTIGAGGGLFTSATVSSTTPNSATSNLTFNSATSGLFNYSGSILGSSIELVNTPSVTQGTNSNNLTAGTSITANSYFLNAGTYAFVVDGSVASTSSSFGGNVSVAAPVPEPTEGALLLSGLGLMGFIATRRSRNQA